MANHDAGVHPCQMPGGSSSRPSQVQTVLNFSSPSRALVIYGVHLEHIHGLLEYTCFPLSFFLPLFSRILSFIFWGPPLLLVLVFQ